MMNFMKTMSENMNNRFDINDVKFDVQNNKFDEQNSKFDELKIDINAVNVRCESNFKELEQNIEKMKEWRRDTGKLSENENKEVTDDNINNGDMMTNNNEEIINGVSGNYKDELTSCLLYTSRCV